MKSIKLGGVFSLLLLAMGSIYAQDQNVLEDSLALDSSIRYGQLENGFSYYIKQLPHGGSKVSMSLIVKAGSDHQGEDQYGMAHFLEHMPFTRTDHFVNIRKNAKLLNEMGMQATDIGGSTGGNQTTYWFNFPSTNGNALHRGLLFFQDIASGDIKFHKEDIDGERGSFFEEYLFSGSEDLYNSLKIANTFSSGYQGLKSPNQYKNYIRNFEVAPLQRFYKKWYRPDLMALIYIGSIENVDSLERKIRTSFSTIKKDASPPTILDTRKNYLSRKNQFTVIKDSVTRTKGLEVPVNFQFFMRMYKNSYEGSQVKQGLLQHMLVEMINKRFIRDQEAYNITYRIRAALAMDLPAIKIEVTAGKDYLERGTKKAFSILHQIKEEGFTRQEFEAFKRTQIASLGKVDTLSSKYWQRQISDHFVLNHHLPENKNAKLKVFWETLALDEFNAFLRHLLSVNPEDIAVIIPMNEEYLFEEDKIRKWIRESKTTTENYIPKKKISYLLPPHQQAELIASKYIDHKKDDLGAKQVTLDNGIKLVLKPFSPTAGRYKNKIMLHGFSPYGASSFPEEQYFTSVFAPDIVRHAGVGHFNKFELREFLKETSIPFGCKAYITSDESGIQADFVPEDLEIALQLIYLYITDPRKDEEAFQDWKTEVKKRHLKDKNLRVKLDFYAMIHKEIGNYSASPQGSDIYEGSKKVNLDKAFINYKTLMQNPQNFTFIVTGDFELDKVLPMLNKYLGNIPQRESSLTTGASKSKILPKRPVRKVYQPDTSIENSHLFFTYIQKTQEPVSLKEKIAAEALTDILNFRLRELRFEKKRAVYLTAARNEINRENNYHAINMMLSCGNEDVLEIENDLEEIVADIKTNGVGEDLFEKVMKSQIPKYSQAKRRQNKEIQSLLYHYYRYNVPIFDEEDVEKIIQSMNKEYIQSFSKIFLANKFLMKFIASSNTEV